MLNVQVHSRDRHAGQQVTVEMQPQYAKDKDAQRG